jgi:ligand-binding SRPBCC domain-containing protein
MLYHFTSEHWVSSPVEHVFHFFADPDNLPRIMPPAQETRLEKVTRVPPPRHPSGLPVESIAGMGSEMVLTFRAVPLRRRVSWRARIIEFEWNRHFRDFQVEGPMKFWTHRHEFETAQRDGHNGTLIRDRVEYDPGCGLLGVFGDAFVIRHALRTTFNYRKQVVERLLVPPQVSEQLKKVGEQLRRLSRQ